MHAIIKDDVVEGCQFECVAAVVGSFSFASRLIVQSDVNTITYVCVAPDGSLTSGTSPVSIDKTTSIFNTIRTDGDFATIVDANGVAGGNFGVYLPGSLIPNANTTYTVYVSFNMNGGAVIPVIFEVKTKKFRQV